MLEAPTARDLTMTPRPLIPRGADTVPLIDPLVNGAGVSLRGRYVAGAWPVLDSHEEMPLPGGAAKGAGLREFA